MTPPAIVLFDGVCNLCDRAVQFLLDHDRAERLVFASLQSDEGRRVLASVGRAPPGPGSDPDTMMLVEGGRAFDRSTAVLRIARRLGFPWSLAAVLLLLPAVLRDPLYRVIARNRYRWFGRHDVCRVPTPETRARFLENRPELLDALP